MTQPNTAGPGERILVIEDELAIRLAITDRLEEEGYRVLTAADGAHGLERALEQNPDLILLDIMLPKLDGLALCKELRRLDRDVPILMLTAKAQVEDRIHGLNTGADDYLVKPFSTGELLARVRALLRRSNRGSQPAPTTLQLGDIRVDFTRCLAWKKEAELHLTPKEFATLKLLAEANGEVVTRERFLDLVWGHTAFPTTRTVDNHVGLLRAKIEPNPAKPHWIKTVFGIGYRLETSSPCNSMTSAKSISTKV